MLDDDTLVSTPDLSFAFSVWKVVRSTKIQMKVVTLTLNCNIHSDTDWSCLVSQQFPDQIVGFVPRKHVSTPGGVYSYGSFELQDPETSGGDK